MTTQFETTQFEDRLLAELKQVVAERAPVRRRRRLTVALVAAVVLVAGGAVAGPALLSSPAYAVERDPDGSIRVYIRDYRDPEGLQRRLAAFGVRAAIDYLPAGADCREPRGDFVPRDQVTLDLVSWGPFGDSGDDPYWKLHPQFLGPDQTFVYTVHLGRDANGERYQRAAIRVANGPVAPCVRVPAG